MSNLSKTQIDALGDRLRKGPLNEPDLLILDAYRKSFNPAYESVIYIMRETLSLAPTGRPSKSTTSIIDKLYRESIRMSQIQDISGCRILTGSITEQERVVKLLCKVFPESTKIDRRVKPTHGYRAVHVIVQIEKKLIEIQIRTMLQHLWAEFSEKLSDYDPRIKYGGGSDAIQKILLHYSTCVVKSENLEVGIQEIKKLSLDKETELKLLKMQKQNTKIKKSISSLLKELISLSDKGRLK